MILHIFHLGLETLDTQLSLLLKAGLALRLGSLGICIVKFFLRRNPLNYWRIIKPHVFNSLPHTYDKRRGKERYVSMRAAMKKVETNTDGPGGDRSAFCQAVLAVGSIRRWPLLQHQGWVTIKKHLSSNYHHHFHACSLQFLFPLGSHPLFPGKHVIPLACHDHCPFMPDPYDTRQGTDMKSQGSTSCIAFPTLSSALRKPTGNLRYSVTKSVKQ